MRAVRFPLLLACLAGLTGFDAPTLRVPGDGQPAERVLALWEQTRPILLADAGQPLSDAQALAHGAPVLDAWTRLEAQLAASDASGETHAVMKLLNDFYGRPQSTPQRRLAIRNRTRAEFAQRLQNVEQRLRR
ncbi:MAG: hypothetical protein RIC56_18625 [Pseudomonadales bacterium]